MRSLDTSGTPETQNHSKRITGMQNLRRIAIFASLTILFAIAYTQSPLFTSNQNQYFLHGFAQAKVGYLEQDWLANTLDPTPVFSMIVRLSQIVFDAIWIYYLYYILLMGIYFFSLIGIASHLYSLRSSSAKFWLYSAVLILIHSAGIRFALSRTLGTNWTYIFEDGVADQRLLGPVFQPSTFGVFLILSVYLFLRKRPYWAIFCAVLAATIHPTYLLGAATLALAYLVVTWVEKRNWGDVLLIAGFALLCATPILFYLLPNFALAPASSSAQAHEILVNFRIPHHAQVRWWFDATALVKIMFVLLAIYLARKMGRMLIILSTLTLVAFSLTVVQVISESNALALIFPWRISTFLVPISIALILANLVEWSFNRIKRLRGDNEKFVITGSLIIIAFAVLVGSVRLILDFERKASEAERLMMAYVKENKSNGDIFLTPVKMQDFRLETGAPVYVDFKSIPYRNADVLEWYRRVQLADQFFNTGDCQILQDILRSEKITRVVTENYYPGPCPQFQLVYDDVDFQVYKIK